MIKTTNNKLNLKKLSAIAANASGAFLMDKQSSQKPKATDPLKMADTIQFLKQQLRQTRKALKREVEERKQAQEALRISQEKLKLALRSSNASTSKICHGELDAETQNSDLAALNEQLQVALEEIKVAEEELRQQNQELEAERQRYQDLFNLAPDGYLVTDRFGKILEANQAIAKLLGINERRSIGKIFAGFIPCQHRQVFRTHLNQTSASEQTQTWELILQSQDGHRFFAEATVACIKDLHHQPIGLRWLIRDISERRAIEQMKSEFISIVSHELRTPLTSIRGSLGLLAAGVLDDEPETAKKMLEIAASESERLARLVDDILDLERLETKKVLLDKQWCDAASLMQQATEAMQSIAESTGIAIASFPHSVQIWVARDRIVQVFVNLLNNAIKFSAAKSTVTLAAEIQPDCVLFKVQDRGKGIPSHKLETIFGRFQQIDASDARVKGGTGLGLAICRNIVQQHGGRIWVESVLGEGSTFYFTLPMPIE